MQSSGMSPFKKSHARSNSSPRHNPIERLGHKEAFDVADSFIYLYFCINRKSGNQQHPILALYHCLDQQVFFSVSNK